MIDNLGCGKQKRRDGGLRVLAGEQTPRYIFLFQDAGTVADLGTTVETPFARC